MKGAEELDQALAFLHLLWIAPNEEIIEWLYPGNFGVYNYYDSDSQYYLRYECSGANQLLPSVCIACESVVGQQLGGNIQYRCPLCRGKDLTKLPKHDVWKYLALGKLGHMNHNWVIVQSLIKEGLIWPSQ